jgi:1-deoxy-D-xylulose-5-phosphate synthase
MLRTALLYDDGPIALRYPRGEGSGVPLPSEPRAIAIGTGEILREAGTGARPPRSAVEGAPEEHSPSEHEPAEGASTPSTTTTMPLARAADGRRVALVGYGSGVGKALEAATLLEGRGLGVTVADARFAKPIDAGLMAQLAAEHDLLVTIEEGVLAGGFGSAVWETLSEMGLTPRILRVGLPDRYITHGKPALLHEEVGFTGAKIAERVAAAILDRDSATVGA